MPEEKSVSLHFQEGSSDKVYHAQLVSRENGWAVTFQYGRRGSTLAPGEKIAGADFDKANKVFDKLVAEKTGKGYVTIGGASPALTAFQERDTGFRPQLLNEMDAEAFAAAVADPDRMADWLVQEKHDGERRVLISDGDTITFANRRGLEVSVQQPVADAFRRLAAIITNHRLVLDAEDMGDHVVIFDVPEHPLMEGGTFRERAAWLENLQKTITYHELGDVLMVDVPTPFRELVARGLHISLEESGAEGIVLRHPESRYAAGRPNSGGDAMKVKFWADITCRVTAGRDGKRSVGLELLDGETWVAVGNVTVPANQQVPEPGALVDVRYLYAYEGGALFQPTLQRARPDVAEEECRISRLKFRREIPNPEPEEAGFEP